MPLERDTRPLGPEELSPGQIETIERLNDLLAEMQAENRSVGDHWALGGGDYTTILAKRSHRVILIEGERGTGKTSLLLTLLRYWRPDTSSLAPVYSRGGRREVAAAAGASGWRAQVQGLNDRSRDEQERLSKLFSHIELAGQIEPLPGVDLDPKPSTMGIHALLLQGFASLVASKCHQGSRRGRRDAEWEHWGEEPEDEAPDLAGLYRQVQRDAIASEGTVEAAVDDIDLAVTQRVAKDKSWIKLRERYWTFIEALLTRLRDTEHRKLLVVSLDDLDLNPQHADDVLQAMRLLWHPQVVFLATGHYEGLVEGVHLSRLRDERRVVVLTDKELQGKTQAERCLDLARRVVEKTLPRKHCLKVPLGPALADVIRKATGEASIASLKWLCHPDEMRESVALSLYLDRLAGTKKAGSLLDAAVVPEARSAIDVLWHWSGLTYRQYEALDASRGRSAVIREWANLLLDGSPPSRINPAVALGYGANRFLPEFLAELAPFDFHEWLQDKKTRASQQAPTLYLASNIFPSFGVTGRDSLFELGEIHQPSNILVLALYVRTPEPYSPVTFELPSIVETALPGRRFNVLHPPPPPVSLVFVERFLLLGRRFSELAPQVLNELGQASNPPLRSPDWGITLYFSLLREEMSKERARQIGSNPQYDTVVTEPFARLSLARAPDVVTRETPVAPVLRAEAAELLQLMPINESNKAWVRDSFPKLVFPCYGLSADCRRALLDVWCETVRGQPKWLIDIPTAWSDVKKQMRADGLDEGSAEDAVLGDRDAMRLVDERFQPKKSNVDRAGKSSGKPTEHNKADPSTGTPPGTPPTDE